MKNITTIILFTLLASLNAKAQGDLQFNRAVFESDTFAHNVSTTTIIDTLYVPQGKVFKITSICTYGLTGNQTIFLGDYKIDRPLNVIFPIWLPTGAHVLKSIITQWASSSTPGNTTTSFSGIEFNVVQ